MSNNNTPNTTTNNMPKFDIIENGSMMMQYHQPKFKYPVEVRPAPGKGNGVFATRTIKKGQVCCFYDGILIEPNLWQGFKEGMTRLTLLGVLISGEHGYNQQFDKHNIISGYVQQFNVFEKLMQSLGVSGYDSHQISVSEAEAKTHAFAIGLDLEAVRNKGDTLMSGASTIDSSVAPVFSFSAGREAGTGKINEVAITHVATYDSLIQMDPATRLLVLST